MFKFLSRLFGHIKNPTRKKDKVNFKIYDVTTGQEAITIYILSSISRNKDIQTMKFRQLIEYDERNIF